MKKSEKLLLMDIFISTRKLQKTQGEIQIGQLIFLIRQQLTMSQHFLAKKAKVPQSTISRIEAGRLRPNLRTLDKIFNALFCRLLISAVPYEDLQIVRQKQARKKAEQKVNYLLGTMALEKQKPDPRFARELIEEEEKKLLQANSKKLWEE